MDLFVSIIAFIVLSPIFIIVMIWLFFTNKGKPFFTQSRPGKNERIFKIIKFKTMTDKADEDGNLLPDIKRVTPVGTFIRKTSLDEIPQLINVIIGDMSLIGPRPLLIEYISLYTEEQKLRHTVRPGITGWAQVNGRNSISWYMKFKFDIEYVNNISLSLDLKILYLTMIKIIKREGINSDNYTTMDAFNGYN